VLPWHNQRRGRCWGGCRCGSGIISAGVTARACQWWLCRCLTVLNFLKDATGASADALLRLEVKCTGERYRDQMTCGARARACSNSLDVDASNAVESELWAIFFWFAAETIVFVLVPARGSEAMPRVITPPTRGFSRRDRMLRRGARMPDRSTLELRRHSSSTSCRVVAPTSRAGGCGQSYRLVLCSKVIVRRSRGLSYATLRDNGA
jgi:hypothetical protein